MILLMALVLRVTGNISLVWDDKQSNLEDEKAITALLYVSSSFPFLGVCTD